MKRAKGAKEKTTLLSLWSTSTKKSCNSETPVNSESEETDSRHESESETETDAAENRDSHETFTERSDR